MSKEGNKDLDQIQQKAVQDRILVLSYEYPPLGGGGAKVVAGLVEQFASRGYIIDVVTMGFSGLAKVERQNAVTIYRVPSIRRHRSRCSAFEMVPYIFFAFLKVLSLTKKNIYLINHTHFIFPDGVIMFFLKFFRKIPFIVTAHGSDVPGYNPNRFKILHVLLMPLWRVIVSRIDRIVCPSEHLRALIHKNTPQVRTIIIPNGIMVDKFTPATHKKENILIVTRMFERKGVQYFLKALHEVKFPGKVNIVGDGPYLHHVQSVVKKLKIRDVTFHGFLDNNSHALKELYESSKIFVFPSEMENFPIVLLEAMTAGLAIITTKDTGCAEVVGDTALLVEPKNVEEIRASLERLMADKDLADELGQKARARVVSYFSWSAVTKQYEDLYRTLS